MLWTVRWELEKEGVEADDSVGLDLSMAARWSRFLYYMSNGKVPENS